MVSTRFLSSRLTHGAPGDSTRLPCLLAQVALLVALASCGAADSGPYWPIPEEVPVVCTGRIYATTLSPVDGLNSFVFSDRVPGFLTPDENWFKSEDGGVTFTPHGTPGVALSDGTLVDSAYKQGLAGLPDDPGIARSTDDGESWQVVEGSPTMIIAVHVLSDDTLFAINDSPYPQLFRSDDLGLTWIWLTPPKFRELAVGGEAIYLYGHDQPGLVRSVDKGNTWQEIEPQDGDLYSASPAWRVAAGSGGRVLFVPSDGGGWPFVGCDLYWGLWRSEDYGDTWVNDLWFGRNTPTPCNAGRPREVVVGAQDKIHLVWDHGRSAFDTFVPLQIWSSDNWGQSWRYMKPRYVDWDPAMDPPAYPVVPVPTENGLIFRLDVAETPEHRKTVWCELGGNDPGGFDALPAPVEDVPAGEIGLAVRFGSGLSSYGLMVTRAGEKLRWETPAVLISGLPDSTPWWEHAGDDWMLRGAAEGGNEEHQLVYALIENFKTGKRSFITLDEAHEDIKTGIGMSEELKFRWDEKRAPYQVIGLHIDSFGLPWVDTDRGMMALKNITESNNMPQVSKNLPADSALSRYAPVAWVFSVAADDPNERFVNRIDLASWDGSLPCDEGPGPDCAPASGWWGKGSVDAADRLYFVDRETHSVVRWDPADPSGWQTVADGFRGPQAVAVDITDPDKIWILDDDLYVARPKAGVVIRRHD